MNLKYNSAYILAVGAVIALSATIMYSCSSDDDYDLYQGDELKTYAATTRAGSESSGGLSSYNSKPLEAKNVIFNFPDDIGEQTCTFTYIVSTSDNFKTFTVSVNNLVKANEYMGNITGRVTNVTLDSGVYKLSLLCTSPLKWDSSIIGRSGFTVKLKKTDFTLSSM